MSYLIFIIGGMSSGKTTTNRGIVEAFKTQEKELFAGEENGVNYAYSHFGEMVTSLGDLRDSQCTGWDSVSTKCKNVGLELSIRKAIEKSEFVVLDSIMSSSVWVDLIVKNSPNNFLIHLTTSFEENVRRLKKRQANKVGKEDFLDVWLTDNNYEFIRKERMQYTNIFDKFKDKFSASIRIDSNDKTPSEVNKEVLKFINKNL